MKTTQNGFSISFLMVFLLAVMAFLMFTATSAAPVAYADESPSKYISFDETDINSDLSSMKDFKGTPYSTEAFPKTEKGDPYLFNFVEYGFSAYDSMIDVFGLYVYIYNPTGAYIGTSSNYNTLTLSTEFETDKNVNGFYIAKEYGIFSLAYCSSTTDNLFYKFKVMDKNNTIIRRLRADINAPRQYDVASINVNYATNGIVSINSAITLSFTGFGAGLGTEESTLNCTSTSLETISLDVHHSYYRIENAADEQGGKVQDTLHTAYFAIPNRFLTEYGKLQKIHYTWEEYQTLPIYILSDKDTYDALLAWVGRILQGYPNSDVPQINPYNAGGMSNTGSVDTPFAYNPETVNDACNYMLFMAYLFYTGNLTADGSTPWADDFILNGETLLDYMVEYSQTHTPVDGLQEQLALLVGDYYDLDREIVINYNGNDVTLNPNLFTGCIDYDRSQDGFELGSNENEIDAGETFNLFAYEETSKWYELLFGKHTYNDLSAKSIKAIEPVTETASISNISSLCGKYYISLTDKDEFYAACQDAEKNDCTLYVFHYAVTDYSSANLDIYFPASSGAYETGDFDSNLNWTSAGEIYYRAAYACQQTVFLNFQVIDLTFNMDNVYTVIPVVSTPVNIVADATPPIDDVTLGSAIRDALDALRDDTQSWWEKMIEVLKLIGLALAAIITVVIFILILTIIIKLIASRNKAPSNNFRRPPNVRGIKNSGTKKKSNRKS